MGDRGATGYRPRAPAGPAPRFLLLMRLPLGDTLFVTPTIQALRRRYPDSVITALAAAGNAPLLAHNPHLDDVVILPFRRDRQGGGALPAALLELRRRRYDVALCLGTPALGWLPYACAIPCREYLDYAPLWWLLPRDYSGWNRLHAVQVYATAGRHLDLPPLERQLVACVTAAEREEANCLLQRLGLSSAPLCIAIHPGSGAAPAQKRWPLEGFAETARALAGRAAAQVLLLGGKGEVVLAQQLAVAIGPPATSLAGTLTLRQTLAVLSVVDLFIGNDSGPLHMATAVGTPVVGVYGPTDPAVFGPWARPGWAAVVRPAEARPVIRFVGGATIWEQLAATRRPDAILDRLPSAPVIQAARRLLAERAEVRQGLL